VALFILGFLTNVGPQRGPVVIFLGQQDAV
jgi:hypothetical protein